MKKTIILTLLASFMIGGHADAQLSKLKDKIGAKAPTVENVEGDVTGNYSCVEGVEVRSGYGTKTVKAVALVLDKKSNEIEFIADKNNKLSFTEISKTSKALKLRAWRIDNASYTSWLVEFEPELMVHIDGHRGDYELKGDEKVVDVMAKDPAKLETWDIETAQAKFESLFGEVRKAAAAKKKAALLEDYPVYKKYVGNVVFAKDYNTFNHGYVDQPKDDEEDFIKATIIGESLFMAAYFDNPVETECGGGCELDIVYEMDGVSVSRVDLRKDKTWQRDIKQLQGGGNTDVFCYSFGHSLWNPRSNVMDYAFWYCLYQNRSKFKEGGTYNLKVTFYASRDGNRGKKMAEGTIALKYDANSQKNALKAFQAVRENAE